MRKICIIIVFALAGIPLLAQNIPEEETVDRL